MQRTILILACFFVCADSFAQHTNLSFQHYTMAEGLSDNYIRNIFQDNRGYIWISTNEGLNRFDGNHFRRFFHNSRDSNTIASNISENCFQLNKNQLLVHSYPILSVFDLNKQQFSTIKNSVLANTLSVSKENSGRLWLGFKDRFLILDSGLNNIKNIVPDSIETLSPVNVHRLNNGKLLAVTSDNLFYIDESSGKRSPVAEFSSIKNKQETYFSYSFYHSASNTLYAGGWSSDLYRIDFNNNTVINLQNKKTGPLYSIPVNTVFKDSRNRLWIGTLFGLLLYDEISGEKIWIKKTTENDGLTDNHVRCIMEDRENNIWIGTVNGLNKLSKSAQAIRFFKKEFERSNRTAEIYDITRLSNNDIIIATYGNGLFKLNESNGRISSLPQPFMTHTWTVREIDNKLFAGGHQELIMANLKDYHFVQTGFLKPYYKKTDLILIAYKDRAGNNWFSMNGGRGLLRQKAGINNIIQYSNEQNPKPFPHNYFNALAEDDSGNIWWGVNKISELVKWNSATESFEVIDLVKIFDQPEKIRKGINCLFYENGHLWIGTDGAGLYDYEISKNKIREYTINEGICGENITQLITDKQNRLWIGTRKGLSCLLPDRKTFINFTTADGLPEIIFNDGACIYDSLKNKLYLSTQFSLLSFNPDELLSHRSSTVNLYINEIFINGLKNTDWIQQALKLKHNQNNIQLNFSVVEFNNTTSLQVEYKLKGISNNWIPAAQQRTISFLNLGDGDYSFHLRVKKPGNDDWNELAIPVRFTILPPVWKTWWFITLLCIIVTGLLVFILRLYYRRKIEQQKLELEKQVAIETERSRIAADMHDDLGAGITRIKFLAEDIEEHLPANADKSEVINLKSSSNELLEKMSEIIWAMNEKNNSLEDLVFYLRSYSIHYLQENTINGAFKLPPEIPPIKVSGELRRNLFLTVKECLHNVVKHAGAKNVVIEMEFGNNLSILIRDDGKGFDLQNILPKSNGLINMKKRIAGLKGKIEFIRDNGTIVHMTIPL